MHQVWRLSEYHEGNLGVACTEYGLVLGRTPLIERRGAEFAVRERIEIERLLSRAYGTELAVERLMTGLATVATAMNANDPGLARIAAVHLRIPDLPDHAARDRWKRRTFLSNQSIGTLLRVRAGWYRLIPAALLTVTAHSLLSRLPEFTRQARTTRSIPVGRPGRKAVAADNFVRRTLPN